MNRFYVLLIDELGDEFGVTVDVPDLVENVTEWIRDEYPESSIVFVRPVT